MPKITLFNVLLPDLVNHLTVFIHLKNGIQCQVDIGLLSLNGKCQYEINIAVQV